MTESIFNGKTALITGGSSGIGLAMARQLRAQGAEVSLLARDPHKLDGAAETLQKEFGGRVSTYSVDVSDWEAVQRAAGDIRAEHGAPDLLINSAGITHPGYVEEIPVDIYHRLMEVNYFGVVHLVKVFLPSMLERGDGRIVNIDSAAGFVGVFGYTAYGASKFALRGFSDALRAELKPRGIRVHLVFPPDTDTPQLAYENEFKPPETRAIAGNAGVLSADRVAEAILRGVERNQYVILPGLETKLLYHAVGLLGNLVYPLMDRLVAGARKKSAR